MRAPLRAILVLICVIAWVAFFVASSGADARTVSIRGVVHVYEVGNASSTTDTDVLTGVITDYGTDHPLITDKLNKLVLSKGSFEVNIAALGKKVAPTAYDLKNCSIVLTGTAPSTISHGTGAYVGISGTVTVTIKETGILPKLKNGLCNQNTPDFVADVDVVTATGTVTLK